MRSDSTDLETGSVKMSMMIRDILVIWPMVCIETYLCTLQHKAHEFHVWDRGVPLDYERLPALMPAWQRPLAGTCYPMLSHGISVSFKIQLIQWDSMWTFFPRPKLHLKNFNLENFQAESRHDLKPVTIHGRRPCLLEPMNLERFPINFWMSQTHAPGKICGKPEGVFQFPTVTREMLWHHVVFCKSSMLIITTRAFSC